MLSFDYPQFCNRLVGKSQIVGIRYYIGAVKRLQGDAKSEALYAGQQKLLSRLDEFGVDVLLGDLIRHPDKSFHEKGVDVRLAVEMIRYARQDAYDVCYLLSSDTDLVPAVEEVQSFGKKVVYVGTAKGQSWGLTKTCDGVILLRQSDIVSFLTPLE